MVPSPSRTSRIETVLSAVMTAAALAMAVVFVRRELYSRPPVVEPAAQAADTALLLTEWNEILATGSRIGPSNAILTIVEFGDFECPFCKRFAGVVRSVQKDHPDEVALVYVHFPLRTHRFAHRSSIAAECARDQGRFEALYNGLFARQDSIGLVPWRSLAQDAGIPDLDAFDRCIEKETPNDRVRRGLNLGTRLGVRGTPTVAMNGWLLPRPPVEAELRESIRSLRAGRSPLPPSLGSRR